MEVAAFNRKLSKSPNDPDLHSSIARWLYSDRLYEWALKNLHRALQIDADHYGAISTLAWLYAACPDKEMRDGHQALVLAKKAYDQGVRRGAKETEWMIRNHFTLLAAAHAEASEWEAAVSYQRLAIECTSTRSHMPELQADLDRYLLSQSAPAAGRSSAGGANDA